MDGCCCQALSCPPRAQHKPAFICEKPMLPLAQICQSQCPLANAKRPARCWAVSKHHLLKWGLHTILMESPPPDPLRFHSLKDVYTTRCLSRAEQIVQGAFHAAHHLLVALRQVLLVHQNPVKQANWHLHSTSRHQAKFTHLIILSHTPTLQHFLTKQKLQLNGFKRTKFSL